MRKSFSANKSVVTEISPEFGLLEKKGKGVIFTSWKKRKFSFSLKDKCLKYFDMKDNLRGALILDDQHEASIVDPIHVNGKEFTFEIFGTKSHPTRGIHIERKVLSAPSNNVRSQWITLINDSLRSITDGFIDDFFVVECIESFKRKGPGALLSQRFNFGQSPTFFGIPALTGGYWWNFPQVSMLLESNCGDIRSEFLTLRDTSPPDKRDHANIPGGGWTVFPLMERGIWHQENCHICPITTSLLREMPLCFCSFGSAYFSVLPPESIVKSHTGPSNSRLRIHLPLIANSQHASLTVGDEMFMYEEGRAITFDSTYEHSISNMCGDERVVLVVDVWHPQLKESAISRLEAFFDPKRSSAVGLEGKECVCGYPIPRLELPAASKYRLKAPPLNEENKSAKPAIDFHYHLLPVGPTGIGKSSFISRFTGTELLEDVYLPTMQVEFSERVVRFRDLNIKLQLWDVDSVTPYYVKLCQGFFICADEDSPAFFDKLIGWYDMIKSYNPQAAIVIVAMKTDLLLDPFLTDVAGISHSSSSASFNGEIIFDQLSSNGVEEEEVVKGNICERSSRDFYPSPEYGPRYGGELFDSLEDVRGSDSMHGSPGLESGGGAREVHCLKDDPSLEEIDSDDSSVESMDPAAIVDRPSSFSLSAPVSPSTSPSPSSSESPSLLPLPSVSASPSPSELPAPSVSLLSDQLAFAPVRQSTPLILPPEAAMWKMDRKVEWLSRRWENVKYVECSSKLGIDICLGFQTTLPVTPRMARVAYAYMHWVSCGDQICSCRVRSRRIGVQKDSPTIE